MDGEADSKQLKRISTLGAGQKKLRRAGGKADRCGTGELPPYWDGPEQGRELDRPEAPRDRASTFQNKTM